MWSWNLAASMYQLNELKYIPPEKAVSRIHEVMHQKSPTKQLDIASDSLVLKESKEVPDLAAQSAMQVSDAFVRRGIALLFADLIDFPKYQKYLSMLFGHMNREPPTGYSRCSVSQIVAADKAVWQKLLQDGVHPRRTPAGDLPLSDGLINALTSYEVSFLLLPLQAKKENANKDKKDKKEKKDKKRHRCLEAPQERRSQRQRQG